MSVSPSDLVWYKSVSTAGGARSAVPIADNVKNNVFPQVTPAQALAGGHNSRKVFVRNEHATDPHPRPSYWLDVLGLGGTTEIGYGWDLADDADEAAGNGITLPSTGVLTLVSDGADTRTIRLVGLDGSGNPLTEDVVLTGTTPIDTAGTFSDLYTSKASALSGSRSVLVKRSTTLVGTISISRIQAFRWVAATTKLLGILLADLVAGASQGIWIRFTWPAASAAVKPDLITPATEEN